MARIQKQKACIACTDSKRRCDKALPSCTRCQDRDVDCRYPPTRRGRHHYPLLQTPAAPEDLPALDATSDLLWNSSWTGIDPPDLSLERHSVLEAPQTVDEDSNPIGTDWFLSPSSWRIDHSLESPRHNYPASVLTNFTRGVQAWIHRWLLQGHNPFIHRALYDQGAGLPPCLQAAFSSVSLYHHKTSENEAFVHRILDDNMTSLVTSQSAPGAPLGTRAHLARVQALFIYTVIGLFDGSVAHRVAAEAHLPTLSLWCKQLWESAIRDADAFSTQLPPPADPRFETYGSDLATYNLWVLSESIRRTWLVVTYTLGVYAAIKGTWTECPGGALFTARAGLWDAPSAPRWAALRRDLAASSKESYIHLQSEKSGGMGGRCDGTMFVPSFQSECLFLTTAAVEIDEFARHIFTVIWGIDRVESWALKTASAGEVCLTY